MVDHGRSNTCSVSKVRMLRDGGSIRLEGRFEPPEINGIASQIKIDRAFRSDTKGQVFAVEYTTDAQSPPIETRIRNADFLQTLYKQIQEHEDQYHYKLKLAKTDIANAVNFST